MYKNYILKATGNFYLLDTAIKMAEKGGRMEFWVTNLVSRVAKNAPD